MLVLQGGSRSYNVPDQGRASRRRKLGCQHRSSSRSPPRKTLPWKLRLTTASEPGRFLRVFGCEEVTSKGVVGSLGVIHAFLCQMLNCSRRQLVLTTYVVRGACTAGGRLFHRLDNLARFLVRTQCQGFNCLMGCLATQVQFFLKTTNSRRTYRFTLYIKPKPKVIS